LVLAIAKTTSWLLAFCTVNCHKEKKRTQRGSEKPLPLLIFQGQALQELAPALSRARDAVAEVSSGLSLHLS
jgi:hypothetical protein